MQSRDQIRNEKKEKVVWGFKKEGVENSEGNGNGYRWSRLMMGSNVSGVESRRVVYAEEARSDISFERNMRVEIASYPTIMTPTQSVNIKL